MYSIKVEGQNSLNPAYLKLNREEKRVGSIFAHICFNIKYKDAKLYFDLASENQLPPKIKYYCLYNSKKVG